MRRKTRFAVVIGIFGLAMISFAVGLQQAYAGAPDSKSGVTPQAINLPSKPGSVQGLGESFEPHLNTGTASYRVPLVLPNGMGGHTPELALAYDGGNGNGVLGIGWKLSLPYIQLQTDKGLPLYTNADKLLHSSGEELVPQTDGSYRFKIEGAFTRFRHIGEMWEATERDGTRWLMGETAAGRQSNVLGVFCWMPQRAIDTNGNEIRYFYDQREGQIYLREVRYNLPRSVAYGAEPISAGVRVQFEYETRPDPITDYRSRSLVLTSQRLKVIEISALGQRVRRYELGYVLQNGLSFLQAVRLLGRDGVRWEDNPTQGMPPITFTYSQVPLAQATNVSMQQPPVVQVGQSSVDLVDINGDTLPDIVHSDPSDGYRFFINRGRGNWDASPVYPAQSPSVQLATDGVQVADADGDGYADLLAKIGTASSSFYFFPNKGGSAWELNSRVDFANSPDFSYEDADVQLVDLDNDKRVDVLRTTPSAYYVYFNSPSGWSSGPNRILDPLAYGSALTFSDPRVKLADMNGDRLQDMVFVMDEQVAYFPSKGMGDFDSAVTMIGSPSFSGRSGTLQLADVNGDGLTDLLCVDRFAVSVWLNQIGTGFAAEVVLTDVPEYIAGETNLRMADMNGDGDTDLLYAAQPSTNATPYQYLDFNGDQQSNLLTTIDNGLGRVIAFSYRTSTDYYVDDWNGGAQWTQRSPVAVPVVSRSTVTDKHGGAIYVTDYSYRNAYYDGVEKTFRGFALAEQRDIGDASAPTQVTQLIFDTGKDNESRKGMLLQKDVLGDGGSCGTNSQAAAQMMQVHETTMLSKRDDRPWTTNDTLPFSIVYRPSSVSSCYSRLINQIATRTVLNGSDGRIVSFSTISQTDTLHFENTATPRREQQSSTYDDYGNKTREFDFGEVAPDGSNPTLGNDERLTYYTYALSPTAWIMDRVSDVRQTDLAGNFVSEQRNYYDGAAYVGLPLGQIAQGKLIRSESNAGPNGGNQWVNTQRLRLDEFGNAIGRMDPNGALDANGNPSAAGHWSEVGFDPVFHAYPISERIYTGNGKSLAMTAAYDFGFGVITRAVDFNGNITLFTYDGLARLSAIAKPGDTLALPTQQFSYTLGNGLSAVETASRETSGTSEVFRAISYVDGLGRALQTRSEGEAGAVVVKDGVRFNGRGGIGEQWLPYFALTPTLSYVVPEITQPKATLRYDPLLRPVQLTQPDNTFTRTVFAPLAQTLFDEEDTAPESSHFNTPITYAFDGLGRLTQVLERNAGKVYTTTYGYDLLDNLTVITDTLGNIKRQRFDALKRKLQIDDPDAGLKTFVYDAMGNVIETVDAKGQQIVFAYDGANRPLSENFILAASDATPDIVYHYDDDKAIDYPNPQNTLGRIAWIEDESGREYLSYDARGNVIGKIKRLRLLDTDGTQDFVMLTQYDALDRPTRLTYPDGFSVTYHYNAQALLEAIPGFVGNLDYAASGQMRVQATTDKVNTVQEFDSRLRLKTLRSVASDGTVLQQFGYHFDGASNITQIDDLRPSRTPVDDDSQTFVLDDLYRLKQARYLAGAKDVITYAYNPIGNMTRMTATAGLTSANLGDMIYGQNAGPHALTQVAVASWRYDRNGNLSNKPGFEYGWDFRDRLRVVTGTTDLVQSHTYDYANQRASKWVQTSQENKLTLYPDRTVEVRDGMLIKYVFAGAVRIAEVRTPLQQIELIRGFEGRSSKTIFLSVYLPAVLKSSVQLDVLSIGLTVQPILPEVEQAQETTVFYHPDHLGSASVLVDGQGVVLERSAYLPFGAERLRVGNADVSRHFTGHLRDVDIGLDYAGARYLDVVTGRFVNVDPLYHFDTGRAIDLPQRFNTLVYALNNPISRTDPLGLEDKGVTTVDVVSVVAKATFYVVTAPHTFGLSLVYGAADLTLAIGDLAAKQRGQESVGGSVIEAGAKLAARALGMSKMERDSAGVIGQFVESVYSTFRIMKGDAGGFVKTAENLAPTIDMVHSTNELAEKYGKTPVGSVRDGPSLTQISGPPVKGALPFKANQSVQSNSVPDVHPKASSK